MSDVRAQANAGRCAAIRAVNVLDTWLIAPDTTCTAAIRGAADEALAEMDDAVRCLLAARAHLMRDVAEIDAARARPAGRSVVT